MGFFNNMNDKPIKSNVWDLYTIEGTVDEEGKNLRIGGICYFGGQFFFDAFKLEIEESPGIWKEITIQNPGLEEWSEDNKPVSWEGQIERVSNFKTRKSESHSYEGKYAMLIYTDGESINIDRTGIMTSCNQPGNMGHIDK